MAITKVGCMKESPKSQKDIHLKNSIYYILNSKKLGEASLAGGICCPLDTAYEQMKATKEMFQKKSGRQGYHFIISLKPGEGTPEIVYAIAMRFADLFLQGKYEAVVAVHTDKPHLHAHIVFNSIDMINGYKFQYRNGDWKHILQPITNELCEEYGLEIMPAEYSEDPKNMSRPSWEREQSYTELIKGDAFYCAMLAEDEQHFIYLLKCLGYDVKEGKHIAVKASGMKRYKRLDTIDEQFAREQLDTLIRYGDKDLARPRVYTFNPQYVKQEKLTPMQKKYYAKLYRLRRIEKNRFTYKSAQFYESIKQMHQLQEEYLYLVRRDIHSFNDLVSCIKDDEFHIELIKDQQKIMYRNRGIAKRKYKTSEMFEAFQDGEAAYRNELDALKAEKQELRDELKIANRCMARELSKAEEQLEALVPITDIEDIDNIYDVDVPENHYKVVEEPELVDEVITEKDCAIDSVIVENSGPVTSKLEYLHMTLGDKVEQYPLVVNDGVDDFKAYLNYLKSLGFENNFDEAYNKFSTVKREFEALNEENLIQAEVDKAMTRAEYIDMTAELFAKGNTEVNVLMFDFSNLDYSMGIKVYRGVLERFHIKKGTMEVYDEFDVLYRENMKGKGQKREEAKKKR